MTAEHFILAAVAFAAVIWLQVAALVVTGVIAAPLLRRGDNGRRAHTRPPSPPPAATGAVLPLPRRRAENQSRSDPQPALSASKAPELDPEIDLLRLAGAIR